jgi:hypothetical protein
MVMENKHMVDGDGVSDYGGDESLKILFSRVKKGSISLQKTKIMVVAAL